MPATYVLFPDNFNLCDVLIRQPCARRLNTGSVAGMPCGVKRNTSGLRKFYQVMHFAKGRTGGFFQHHVTACKDCAARIRIAKLRGRAKRDAGDIGTRGQKGIKIGKALYPAHLRIARGGSGKLERGVL